MSVQFDIFSDILNMIRLSGTVYFRIDLGVAMGMEIPSSEHKMFYIVERGECWVAGEFTEAPIRLCTGDIVTFPHGDHHILCSNSDDSVLYPYTEVLIAHKQGKTLSANGEHVTTLVWGYIDFHRNIMHPFIQHLPSIIHIRTAERGDLDWLKSITNKVMQESKSSLPGSDVIVNRLAEVLHLYMLRTFMLEQSTLNSYWTVFNDLQVYQALQYIHQNPESPWTLDLLASKVGLSRTSLATRFKEKVDITPMRYITLWRMHKAFDLLETTNMSIFAIAKQVGYSSEAALTRAFQRQYDITPGKVRQGRL